MGLLDYFRREKREEETTVEPSWDVLSGGGIGGGVTPQMAENLSTVLACVQVISSSVASLPAYTYRAGDRGRDVVEDHPLQGMIERGPSRYHTWADFIEFVLSQALLWGNALAWVKYDRNGVLTEIRPIPWQNVAWELLKNGKLRYRVTLPHEQQQRTLLEHEVLHIRDRSDDSIIGKSRLARAASSFRTSIALQEFSESLYRNGTAPSGALKHDSKLGKEAVELLRQRFEAAHQGAAKAGKVLILDQGLQWESMSISPEDAELLGSRKFSTEEIARIYGCPPPLVGIWDHSSFTNSETAGRWFAQFTIGPWVRKIESEFKRSVFTEVERDLSLEIDLTGFMRGDYETRWKAHKIAVDSNILTTDEIREIEGWGPGGAV